MAQASVPATLSTSNMLRDHKLAVGIHVADLIVVRNAVKLLLALARTGSCGMVAAASYLQLQSASDVDYQQHFTSRV